MSWRHERREGGRFQKRNPCVLSHKHVTAHSGARGRMRGLEGKRADRPIGRGGRISQSLLPGTQTDRQAALDALTSNNGLNGMGGKRESGTPFLLFSFPSR